MILLWKKSKAQFSLGFMIKNKNLNIVRLLTILFLLIIFPYCQCKSEKETTHADDQTEVSKFENKEVHALGDT